MWAIARWYGPVLLDRWGENSGDEDSCRLGCYAMSTGKELPSFWRHCFSSKRPCLPVVTA